MKVSIRLIYLLARWLAYGSLFSLFTAIGYSLIDKFANGKFESFISEMYVTSALCLVASVLCASVAWSLKTDFVAHGEASRAG